MHGGVPCDPIQGQGQGHRASEIPKIALFKVYLLRHLQWEVANNNRLLFANKLEHPQYLNLVGLDF